MKSGEIIRVKNNAGYMTIQLEIELPMEDVSQLGLNVEKVRWEFYKVQDNGSPYFLSTIFSDINGNRVIYLSFYKMYSDEVSLWLGTIIEFEHENKIMYFEKIER